MRNLKRALSMLLTSTMVLGMLVMGSSAAGYQDVDASNKNQEAIEVLQAVGIMSGIDDAGNFAPDQAVTRNQMAVIMAHLLNLDYDYYRGTNTFTDVPDWAAPYVAACVAEGVTAGIGNNMYGGENKITAAQGSLMIMKALGYFQNQEDFGTDWQVATIRQASYIDLFNNIDSTAEAALTRGQVAQLVLNGLKAKKVNFTGDKGIQIGDVTVGYRAEYTPVTNAAEKYNTIDDGTTTINADNGQYFVQLGEELYNGDLKLQPATDVFGRPSRYWEYNGDEVGTYVKTELIRKEYTEKVTGRDLYDLLGSSTINEYGLSVYVDGETQQSVLGSAYFAANNLIRSNTEAVGQTGNGVLTQVFVDTQNKHITISIINTYLAKADESYDEKNEEVDLTIYEIDKLGTPSAPIYVKAANTKTGYTMDADEFDIAEVAEDDLFLVTMADGAVQTMTAPEILSDTVVSNFKLDSYVTADGTQYDYANTVMYDEEVLDAYDDANMKDLTYNIILDPYGYMIGIERNQDPDKYVFLTGLDGNTSNLSKKTADANVIFLDGTMDTVTVKMDKSTISHLSDGTKNLSQLNTWCTYTVDSNGDYTLKEVANTLNPADVAQYAQDVNTQRDAGVATKTISKKFVSLNSGASTYVYGNDDTVYLNVELEKVVVTDGQDGGTSRWIIDDVESVTTGVKNANLIMSNLTNKDGYVAPDAEIYTLFNDDGYVIAAVTIGENDGASSSYAYITSSQPNREAYDEQTRATSSGQWTWTREAVVNGEIVELKEVGDTLEWLSAANMVRGNWYEVKYDADGNVRKAEAITFSTGNNSADANKFISEVLDVQSSVNSNETVLLADLGNHGNANYDITKLTFKNGTLYTNTAATLGFSVSPDVKVILALADRNSLPFDSVSDGYTGYTGLEKALRDMNAPENGFAAASVEISAILENGVATTIVINDKNPADDGTGGNPGQNFDYTPVVTQRGTFLDVQAHTTDADGMEVYTGAWNWLVNNGYSVISANVVAGNWQFFVSKGGNNTFFNTNLITMIKMYVNGVEQYVKADGSVTWGDVLTGDYYAYSSSPITTVGLTTATALSGSASTPITSSNFSTHDGIYFKDSLYQVTVGSTPTYYQIGEKITLTGSHYTTTGGTGSNVTNAPIPAGGLKMSADLKGKTITAAWKVTSTLNNKTEVQYVADTNNATFTTATFAANQYVYDSLNNKYVKVSTLNQIDNVTSDMSIDDEGFYKVNGTVQVTGADTATNIGGMIVSASVSGGEQYIRTGDSVTVNLTLTPNGSAATGDVKAQLSATGTSTIDSTPDFDTAATLLIDQSEDADALTVTSITVDITPNASDVTLKLALSNG